MLVADVRRPLYLLWGGVACVLLIGVVNLAALTLARATGAASRDGHPAGARRRSRAACGQQLVTEHVALAALGGMLGAGVAWALRDRGFPAPPWRSVPPGRTVALMPLRVGLRAPASRSWSAWCSG